MPIIWFVLCAFLIISCVYIIIRRSRLYQLSRDIPWVRPFIPFVLSNHHIVPMLVKLTRVSTPQKIWLFNKLYILVSKPRHYELCFKYCFDGPEIADISRWLFGEGLIIANSPVWQTSRKLLLSAYKQIDGRNFSNNETEKLIQELKKNCDQAIDAFDFVRVTIFRIMNGILLGECKIEYTEFHKNMQIATKLIVDRTISIFLHPDAIYKRTASYTKSQHLKEYFRCLLKETIDEKRRNKQLAKGLAEVSGSNADNANLLEVLINSAGVNDEQIRDEIITSLFSGYETTSIATCFVLLMLAMHTDVQNKVYAEINSESNLDKLEYLDQVIKETLRLFPPASILFRKATEDLHMDSYCIPNGATVVFGIIGIHRNPEYFRNPLQFDPNRFSKKNIGEIDRFSYVPFAGYPRNCLGKKISISIIKVIMSKIIKTFEVDTDVKSVDSIRLQQGINIKPVEGFKIRLKLR